MKRHFVRGVFFVYGSSRHHCECSGDYTKRHCEEAKTTQPLSQLATDSSP